MRIHVGPQVISTDLYRAAEVARADLQLTVHGSRKSHHAYEVKLTGESRRHPNFWDGSDVHAATWDQWGVFLAQVFHSDPIAIAGPYEGEGEFIFRTDGRFLNRQYEVDYATGQIWWPADAHGDHTFRWNGVPREQKCTKCTALQRW